MSTPPAVQTASGDVADARRLNDAYDALRKEIAKVIVGQETIVEHMLIALLSRGHCLLVGVPGLAKTLLIRTLAQVLDLKFNRIQFTPDLMPSDITGTEIIEEQPRSGAKEFRFIRGPLFANIVLADEINRTPPKTQAALLEAMQEHRVTAAGTTYTLTEPFFVLATQNPIEQEGTYPLPEAQLDRFMFNLWLEYPSPAEEVQIVKSTTSLHVPSPRHILTGEQIVRFQDLVRHVPVADNVLEYAVKLVGTTRPGGASAPKFVKDWIRWGAGPRASQYLILGAKTRALLTGRHTPDIDDVRVMAGPTLRHRLVTTFQRRSRRRDRNRNRRPARSRAALSTMPQIDLRLGIPTALALIAVVAAVVAAVFYYRATIPPVTRTKRRILTFLRGLTLALMAFLLCEPLLRFVFTTASAPTLTVLVDNSRSMSIMERGGSRGDVARALLRSPALKALSDRATVNIVPFGTTVRIGEGIPSDSLSFTDDGTDIAGALSALQLNDPALHSNAVLLLTDGIVTLGQNPVLLASSFPVPVTTVGIGDSSEQMDVSVRRIASNAVVYSGIATPVQVMVHASGYQNERVEVTLADGNTVAGRSFVTLEAGSNDYAVPLTWTPATEGVHTLSATVSNLPGELTQRNNRRTTAVRVRKSKLRLFIIAGSPSHDLAFLRTAAEEDRTVSVSTFTQTPGGEFYEGALTNAALDSADCLVLLGMPTAATATPTLEALAAVMNRRHLPLFWIGSRSVDVQRSGALSPYLPFTVTGASQAEQEISIEPVPAERTAPLLAPAQPEDPSPWRELPPIFTTRTLYTAKPGTTVLATARMQTVITPSPALIVRNQPHQRSIALLGYGIWRWRLLAQRSPAVTAFFPHFIANVIRWLTAPDDTAPLVVKPLAASFGQGEPLSFEAQVYDVRQRPVEDAQVRIVVRQRNQAIEGLLTPAGNGRYEGTLPGLSDEGVYAYRASAGKEGVILGADSGTVRVGGTHVEFLTTQTNTALLRTIAARSGGAYLTPGEISRLPDELSRQGFFTPRITTVESELHLRSWPYLFGAIVLLLAIEWLIRKRSGMM